METITPNSCTVKVGKRYLDYTISWECPHCKAQNESYHYTDRDPFEDPTMFFFINEVCSSCDVGNVEVEGDYDNDLFF